MIIDTLDNLGKYTALNPLFADVVEFLKTHDLQTMEAGKYPIKDKDLFLNLTVAKGRAKEAATLETHIDMIDIQIPLSCNETFGYTPLGDLPEFEYNAEKDITKYGTTMVKSLLQRKLQLLKKPQRRRNLAPRRLRRLLTRLLRSTLVL